MQASQATSSVPTTPFRSAEEAWFWGQNDQSQKNAIVRPCTALEIFKMLDRLYRQRRLTLDHLYVMRFYGRRQKRPNPAVRQEVRAHALWVDAMRCLHNVLEQNGIVQSRLQRALIDLSLERAMKDIPHEPTNHAHAGH